MLGVEVVQGILQLFPTAAQVVEELAMLQEAQDQMEL
jgi:hypothetical protein